MRNYFLSRILLAILVAFCIAKLLKKIKTKKNGPLSEAMQHEKEELLVLLLYLICFFWVCFLLA